jgi:tripartite ATP-independent transporter DctP family solute receptor
VVSRGFQVATGSAERRQGVIFLLGAVLLAAGCQAARGQKVIKLGHGLDRSHSVHQAMEFMAQRVAEKSGGRIQVQVYPSEQLGSERQVLELLQLGSIGMTKVSTAVMESFAPQFKVFSIPYLLGDKEHQFKVLDGPIGKEVLLAGEPYWLRGMAYYDAGSRSFYTKARPVREPKDLRGMKIRVMPSNTSLRMVRTLGGAATPIPFGELYTALQQGVVDGAENNPPSFYLTRHYEICRYYSLDEHTAIPDVLVISTHLWSRLTPEEQGWLQEAVDESVTLQRQLWEQSEREALEAVEKAGVEIIRPDKSLFQKQVQSMHEEFKKDPAVGDLIARIQAIP